MTKEIILLSGGLDSIVLACKLKNEGKNLRAVYCDLGGTRTLPELTSVKYVTQLLNIPLEVANLRELNNLYVGYLPLNHIRIDGGDTVDPKPNDLLPFTNIPTGISIMLAIAMYYAHLTKSEKINLGFIANQSEHYPKLSEYLKSLSQTDKLINPNFNILELSAPFTGFKKSEIIKLGVSLNAPIEISWSCIRNSEIHCGECYACKERKSSFIEAGVIDRTNYKV